MNSAEAIEFLSQAIWTLILIAAPPLLVALAVGLVISLFQALTQIQEATLTFVPKILAMLLTMILAMGFIFETLSIFAEGLYLRIGAG